MTKLDRINPLVDTSVSEQLDAWASRLETVVANLNKTLMEIRTLNQEGGDGADGNEPGAGTVGGG